MNCTPSTKLKAQEPEFSAATIHLGEDISQQLIIASHRARPRWTELFQRYPNMFEELRYRAQSKLHTIRHPLVSGFITEWARHVPWGVQPSNYFDSIELKVPSSHLERLSKLGGVESFSFMLADCAGFCSANLGGNEDNLEFGLFINCPAWMELASYEEHKDYFDRQIYMVVQHEMAHFRHRRAGLRSEAHAHCRGIASLLWKNSMPTSLEDFRVKLKHEWPESSKNKEIQALISEHGETFWRLVRLWIHMFKKYTSFP